MLTEPLTLQSIHDSPEVRPAREGLARARAAQEEAKARVAALRGRLIPPREQRTTDPLWQAPSSREHFEAQRDLPEAERAVIQAGLALEDAQTALRAAREGARRALAPALHARMADLLQTLAHALGPAIRANQAVLAFQDEALQLADDPATSYLALGWHGALTRERFVEWQESLTRAGYRVAGEGGP